MYFGKEVNNNTTKKLERFKIFNVLMSFLAFLFFFGIITIFLKQLSEPLCSKK